MEKIKTYCYKAMAYDNYTQDEGETIFFATKKQAINYVDFMKKYDPNTKEGYTTYTIGKQVVYLSEYAMIINYLKNEIRDLEDELEELKNDNDYFSKNQELEYETKIKEKEELLKFYKEKTMNNNDKENDLEM